MVDGLDREKTRQMRYRASDMPETGKTQGSIGGTIETQDRVSRWPQGESRKPK